MSFQVLLTKPDAIRGALLRALRETLGITLRDGAARIGCSVVELSNLELARIAITEESWRRVIDVLRGQNNVLFDES